jgi:hypothetical protein
MLHFPYIILNMIWNTVCNIVIYVTLPYLYYTAMKVCTLFAMDTYFQFWLHRTTITPVIYLYCLCTTTIKSVVSYVCIVYLRQQYNVCNN